MTRKDLVHKLAEHLEVRPVYLAAPALLTKLEIYR